MRLAMQRAHSLFEAHAIAPSPEVIMNRRVQIGTCIAVATVLLLPRRCSPYSGGGCPENWAVPAPEHAVGLPARSS
jgi:hypothetical protein